MNLERGAERMDRDAMCLSNSHLERDFSRN